MKFNPRIQYALAVIASVLVVACGGGGAQTNPNQGGSLSLLPSGGTFFAGVAYTMTLSGGRAPYSLTSDESDVLPVPAIVNGNTFQVVGNNPGVIDVGLAAGALPVRTVNLTARDSAGQTATATIKVGQNFLTGYTLSFPSTSCSLGTNVTTIAPCAGGDTVARVDAVINGNLVGGAAFQFDVVTGNMGFVNPIGSNTVTQSFTATSDHQGAVTAIVRVPPGVATQIGIIRVTYVATGVSNVYAFTILGATGSAMTAIPSTFTFTGAAGVCGSGSGDFFVSGGVPPYHAVSSSSQVAVVSDDNGQGHFTLTTAGAPCGSYSIIITDSGNSNPVNSATVTVTISAGAVVAPPTPPTPTPLTAAPSSVTLACGTSSTVTVVGGSGTYSATSTAPGYITSIVTGNTVTITRRGDDTTNPPLTTTSQSVNITDGASIATIAVDAGSLHCP
ncbi:MAG: hypothetical protein WA190_07110 [Usitatibacter sp.]